jgi:hypothetical protein
MLPPGPRSTRPLLPFRLCDHIRRATRNEYKIAGFDYGGITLTNPCRNER